MMNDLFVKEIASLAEVKVVSIAGKEYSTSEVFEAPEPVQHSFPCVQLETLDSLVDYINDDKDKNGKELQIIAGYNTVQVVSEPRGKQRQRDIFVQARCAWPDHKSGAWMGLEDFRIHLLTMFADGGERGSVLKFISGIVDEAVQTSRDDGVSQTVTAKKGLASFEQVPVPSPVILSPYRTFMEVEQPQSSFLFRMRKSGSGPEAALFEVIGPWKRTAAIRIKDYLKDKLLDLPTTILA